MSKRIAVLGTGANGASIGADLTRAGHNVVLIDQWPEHVAAMRKHGVRVEMPGETLVQPVRPTICATSARFTEPFDIVLLLMKAYDTRWATQLIEPYLAPDGLVAGVQNGMTTDTIAEVVGPERTMGCVIEISSMMFEPGIVHRHSPPPRSWFAVGSIAPATKGRETEIAELLRHSGVGRDRRRHPGDQVDEAGQQRDHPRLDRHPGGFDPRGRSLAGDARADASLGPRGA